MKFRQPPALATWLLNRLGYTRQNAALAGDLLEEFQSGRSQAWYWRQTVMVIVNGLGRNAVVLQAYLKAVVVGFAAQTPVAFALWWFHSPPEIHGVGWGVLVLLSVLSGSFLWSLMKWSIVGPSADLKRLLCAGRSGSQNRPAIKALVGFETFMTYLLGYCICALFLRRLSLGDLIFTEMLWLVLGELTPALVRVPSTGREPAAKAPALADQSQKPPVYPPHELGLLVALADGKTILLRPETVVEQVFIAADEELATAVFQRTASLELLRRAIWLGCARHYGAIRIDPPATPMISLPDLTSLVEEAARSKSVERFGYTRIPESYWQRVRRCFRLRAA